MYSYTIMKNKKLLQQVIKETIMNENDSWQKVLYVFDFDDTLAKTKSKIYVTNELTGENFSLTPAEFAMYEPRAEDEFDFSEFNKLIRPQEIDWTLKLLRRVVEKYGHDGAVILTARQFARPVRRFLKDRGLGDIQIQPLGDGHPEKKSNWISAVIQNLNLEKLVFFDDSHKNVEVVRNIKEKFPDVKILVRHVAH